MIKQIIIESVKDFDLGNWKKYAAVHPIFFTFSAFIMFLIAFILLVASINYALLALISFNLIQQPINNSQNEIELVRILEWISLNSAKIGDYAEFSRPATYRNIFGSYSIILTTIDYLIRTGMSIVFLYNFLKIIWSAVTNNPFDRKNINRIRIVGVLVCFSPVFLWSLTTLLGLFKHTRILVQFSNEAKFYMSYHTPDIVYFLSDPRLVFGVLAFVVAEMLKLGINLKQENDLTV